MTDNTFMKVYDWNISTIKEMEVPTFLKLPAPVNKVLLHEVITYQENLKRRATYGTKNRSEISCSTRKIRAQKRTGRARIGDRSAPHLRGGAVVFGPDGRKYDGSISKEKIKKVLAQALSRYLREGNLIVLENMHMHKIKTNQFVKHMKNLHMHDALFVDVLSKDVEQSNFLKSMQNIPTAHFIPVIGINPLSVLKRKKVVMTRAAIESLKERYKKKRDINEQHKV